MEVADLVQEALERNGTFSSLKAQLRASVQRIIEGGSADATKNAAVAHLTSSEDGVHTVLLLQDALRRLGLEQTLLAFKAECGESVCRTPFLRIEYLLILCFESSFPSQRTPP